MKILKPKILSLIFIFVIAMSCDSNEDVEKLCIEPPTGTIDPFALNLAVAGIRTEGLELFNSITLIKDNEEYHLDTSSFSRKVFSSWQIIPYSGNMTLAIKTIDDVTYEFNDVFFPNETELVLQISKNNDSFVVEVKKYIVCDDTPDG